jgi:hypothetical protein
MKSVAEYEKKESINESHSEPAVMLDRLQFNL